MAIGRYQCGSDLRTALTRLLSHNDSPLTWFRSIDLAESELPRAVLGALASLTGGTSFEEKKIKVIRSFAVILGVHGYPKGAGTLGDLYRVAALRRFTVEMKNYLLGSEVLAIGPAHLRRQAALTSGLEPVGVLVDINIDTKIVSDAVAEFSSSRHNPEYFLDHLESHSIAHKDSASRVAVASVRLGSI